MPRYPDSVHIFGDMVSGVFQPLGTCFAISPQHLLTVRHHMESNRLVGYGIVPYVSRLRSGAVEIPRGFPRPVRVLQFNTDMDYAILEVGDGGGRGRGRGDDGEDLKPIPISLEEVEAEMDLKIYHCPVDLFNDERVKDLTVFSGCVQTARPTAHHVTCNVGLYSGSSGGPFISCRSGGAVGMHVESVPTARDVDPMAVATSVPTAEDAAEIVSDTENSRGTNHAAFSRALLFRTCPKLVRALQQLRIL